MQSFHLNSFVLHMEQDCFLHDVCVVHSVKCKLDFSGCMHVCVVGQMRFRSKCNSFVSQPLVIHDFMND